MNREIIGISITGVSGVKRMELIDCMSRCIASHKRPHIVMPEGFANDAGIDSVPLSTTVVIIAAEKEVERVAVAVVEETGERVVIVDQELMGEI
jgi:hypothetical protein